MSKEQPKQKRCMNCLVYKDMNMFHNNSANKDLKGSYCKPCQKARLQNWRKESFGVRVAWEQKTKLAAYGLTQETYSLLETKQGGACGICGLRRLRGRDKYLHIDHCHKTGRIRGLLCYVCNTTLGKYEKWRIQIENYLKI